MHEIETEPLRDSNGGNIDVAPPSPTIKELCPPSPILYDLWSLSHPESPNRQSQREVPNKSMEKGAMVIKLLSSEESVVHGATDRQMVTYNALDAFSMATRGGV
ncbi:hypothetical protein TorRG33x02_230300 [Trema orientale]|uniref:Uncharacterized protein n=1 Tax=Trema orientale TaxID=63057 RepID=A0A2P5E6J6_TREOI|nr:hypothetical protein TorRG33x02_230300 [Trema orientale]